MDTGTNSPITPAISSTAPTNKTNRRTVTFELLFHSTTTSADIPAPNDAKQQAMSMRRAARLRHGSRSSMKTAAPGTTLSRGGGKDA
jgi:hypothetical protein